MRRLLLAMAIAAGALYQAGTASAGCLATVALGPPPAGIAPGETWTAEMTVLQHGRTPLPDASTARPTLTIVNDSTGERRTFTAHPTKDPTTFAAAVAFPSAGSWRYEVFDDFTSAGGKPEPCARTHTFPAVAVGGSAAGGGTPPAPEPAPAPAEPVVAASAETSGEGFPVWPVVASCLAALAALALGAALVRRRRAARGPEVALR